MRTAYKSIQVFKNPLLEKFTHVHPLTPLIFWGPPALWLIWRSFQNPELTGWGILAASVGGFVAWTFAEYVLHRFIFHFEPKGYLQERLHFIIHGMHHADPVDPTRLVMSPIVGGLLAVIFYSLFLWALGPDLVEPFFAFFLVGYLCYDYTHYAVHHFTPRTSFGKFLKQSHMIHHYVNHEARWGVSSPLWDLVFRTYSETSVNGRPAPAKKKPQMKVRHGT